MSIPVVNPVRPDPDISDVWNGYMDGAIRSGRRATDEILTELS